MKRRYPFYLPPFSHRQIAPPATPMPPPSTVSSFAADYPPIKPFPSLFGDDPLLISENLHRVCAQTLIEAESQVAAANSLISSIYEALDAPLFGESEVSFFDSEFSENTADDSTGLESGVDDSVVPETFFGEPMDVEDEGFLELCGGELVQQRVEAVSVTAEEEVAPARSPLCSDLEEMIGLLIPAYRKLVRSFPYLVFPLGQQV